MKMLITALPPILERFYEGLTPKQ